MSITSFEIISVPVSDQERSLRFYRDVLGFALIREEPMGPEVRWIQLSPQGCATTIALVTWFEAMPAGVLQGVMLNVTDIEADRAGLTGRGLVVSEIGEQPWGRYATFAVPDGNGWILREPPGGATR